MRYHGVCTTCGARPTILRHPTHPTADYNREANLLYKCDECGTHVSMTPFEIVVRNIRTDGLPPDRPKRLREELGVEAEQVLRAEISKHGGVPIRAVRSTQREPEVDGEETWAWELDYSCE